MLKKEFLKVVIAALAVFAFTFVVQPVDAADNANVVYEGTHDFETCLERVGCAAPGSWGICGSNKYPYSDQQAGEKTTDFVEFTVLQKAKIRFDIKNIKKCFNGCNGWFDRQVSGEWRYAGNTLWEAEPGKYKLYVQSDAYQGCGYPYIPTTFCPSSCVVKLIVEPFDPSVVPRNAVQVNKVTLHDGSQHTISGPISDHRLRNWVITNTSHLFNGSDRSAGNAGETKNPSGPVIRSMTREDIIEYNHIVWQDELNQINEEFANDLKKISMELGDKLLGYYPGTATYWATIKGITQIANADWKNASNSFLGIIPYKNLGTLYSLFWDYYSVLSQNGTSTSSLMVPGYKYEAPAYVPSALVVFPVHK